MQCRRFWGGKQSCRDHTWCTSAHLCTSGLFITQANDRNKGAFILNVLSVESSAALWLKLNAPTCRPAGIFGAGGRLWTQREQKSSRLTDYFCIFTSSRGLHCQHVNSDTIIWVQLQWTLHVQVINTPNCMLTVWDLTFSSFNIWWIHIIFPTNHSCSPEDEPSCVCWSWRPILQRVDSCLWEKYLAFNI